MTKAVRTFSHWVCGLAPVLNWLIFVHLGSHITGITTIWLSSSKYTKIARLWVFLICFRVTRQYQEFSFSVATRMQIQDIYLCQEGRESVWGLCVAFLEGETSVKEGMSVWNSPLVPMLGRKSKGTDRQISRVNISRTPSSFPEPMVVSLVSRGQKILW